MSTRTDIAIFTARIQPAGVPSGWLAAGVIADDAPLIGIHRTSDSVVSTAYGRNGVTHVMEILDPDPVILALIWGDPLAVVALAFRHVDPHWYLNGVARGDR